MWLTESVSTSNKRSQNTSTSDSVLFVSPLRILSTLCSDHFPYPVDKMYCVIEVSISHCQVAITFRL